MFRRPPKYQPERLRSEIKVARNTPVTKNPNFSLLPPLNFLENCISSLLSGHPGVASVKFRYEHELSLSICLFGVTIKKWAKKSALVELENSNAYSPVQSIVLYTNQDPRAPMFVAFRDGNTRIIDAAIIPMFIKELQRLRIDEHLILQIKARYPDSLGLPEPSQEHLKHLYEQIKGILKQGSADAKASGKKLLILAGEDHFSKNSFFLQLLLLYAAAELKIGNNFLEFPNQKFLKSHTPMDSKLPELTTNIESANVAESELEMKLTPVDKMQATMQEAADYPSREKHMVSQMCANLVDSIFIHGADHLQGLMNSSELTRKFHVVAFEICDYSSNTAKSMISESQTPDAAKFSQTSPRVIHLKLQGGVFHLENDQIISLAREIAGRPKIANRQSNRY